MIRINLLARKVSKKKAGAIQHLAIGVAVLLFLAAALAWVWFDQAGKLARLKTQIAAQEAEKVRLKNVNEEKGKFEKEKAELERKLAIITKLQKERIVPVHLLDELTRAIDVGTPVWVTSYAYTAGGVTIDGYALSHESLRPLVDGLEKSAYYKGVELLFSERTELQGREVFRFSIKSGVEQPE
ncbi:MAG TPA: PilN domain-containing protein [Candidatus Methanoperedens sp.]|nr:PilN domain-containing protein [Candidatus Methanoperedens sp.]